jgi:hypothetical protein
MPATLRTGLILDLDAGDANTLERPDRPRDRECVSPAGVDIDEHREIDRGDDARGVDDDVAEVRQAEIREAERMIRDARSREVQRTKPRTSGQHRGIRVDRSGHLERRLVPDCAPQLRARGHETSRGHETTAHASGGMCTFTVAASTRLALWAISAIPRASSSYW